MTEPTPHVLADVSERVLWLTLNRPKQRNPLSLAMIAALGEQIMLANQNPEINRV